MVPMRRSSLAVLLGTLALAALRASPALQISADANAPALRPLPHAWSLCVGAGRANATYNWQNPRTGVRGQLHVLDYYEDEDNFRCAAYSQTIYVDGRPQEARGRACQQPDGAWAIVD